jgi:hypothetical protein
MDRRPLDRLGAALRREHAGALADALPDRLRKLAGEAEHARALQETADRSFEPSLYKLLMTIRKPKPRRFSLVRAWRQI